MKTILKIILSRILEYIIIKLVMCVFKIMLFQSYHEPTTLDRENIIQTSQLSNMTRFSRILSKILVPRVPGSESHNKVKNVSFYLAVKL